MRGVVSEEIRKDERSRGGRLRELPPGPSKSRGGWLCPILLGTLESVVAGVCVAEERGWAFTGTYDDVNSRHAGSQGTK